MKRITIIVLFLFLGMHFAFAQGRVVTGTVTSATDGSTIPGVQVVVKGTTVGTTTNMDGVYSLSVPESATTLQFTFIGMKATEVVIGNQTTINLAMEEDLLLLDEVIVVAYGIQRKEANTGSVSVVSEDQIKSIPVTSPEKLLQGKMAGVQVNNSTGQPGGATQIRIRGISSINASNEPLYVVDGVAVASGDYSSMTSTGNQLASLNPNDIASITVLKDASAASVYGSRAANGVILITTKTGKKGAAKVNFSARYGVGDIANDNNYRVMNPDEIYGYMRQALINSGKDPLTYSLYEAGDNFFASPTLPSSVKTYDWADKAVDKSIYKNYQLSVSGGTDNTSYYTSMAFTDNQAILFGAGLKTYSFRTNIDQIVSDKFKIGTKVNLSHKEMTDKPNDAMYYVNPFWASSNILPWELPYNEDGSYNFKLPSGANTNFLAADEFDDQWSKQYKVNGSIYAEYEIIPGLSFKTNNSLEMMFNESRRWWDPRSGPAGEEKGTLQIYNNRLERYTTTNTLNYSKTFAEKHLLRVLLGQEAFKHKYQTNYAQGEELGSKIPYLSGATQALSNVGYGYTSYTLLSFFGIVDYNYEDKYMFSGSLRRDGNSKFGINSRWGTFYSLAASWNMHNEEFIKNYDFVNMLKLRASYGTNGNDGIGAYDQYGTYAAGEYNGISIAYPNNLGKPSLGWEFNTSWNIGLDFAIYDNLQGSFDYYDRKTSDMLLDIPISRTAGFNSVQSNIGELTNKGWELNLTYSAISTKDLSIDIRANIAHNKTTLDYLGEDVEEIADGFWRRHRLGGGFSDYYVYDYAGVNPATGNAMWYDEDKNLTDKYSEANRVFQGQIQPKLIGGFGFDIAYKDFTMSTSFTWKTGHYVYIMENRYVRSDGFAWPNNQNAGLLDYWREPGDITGTPKPLVTNGTNSNAWGTSRYLEKGDYLRLKDITISYNLPASILDKAKISSLRVYVSGVNLWTLHDVGYYTPERPINGGGYIVFPEAKSITFGVDVGF